MRGLVAHEGREGIEVVTSADSVDGFMTWSTTSAVDTQISHCYQSFAHSRVKELLQFRDAVILLGRDMEPFSPLTPEYYLFTSLASCAESEAVSTALAGGLVWPGLTALVTLADTNCQSFGNIPICCDDGMGDMENEGGGEDSTAAHSPPPPSPWTPTDSDSGPTWTADNGGYVGAYVPAASPPPPTISSNCVSNPLH